MYILTHELVHIRSLDCLRKWLLTSALCVHWFNPLVWLMVYTANRDLELACDETVLRLHRKTSYCILLITVLTLTLSFTVFATRAPAQKEMPSPAVFAALTLNAAAAKPEQAQLTAVDDPTSAQTDASDEEVQAADWTWPCGNHSAKVLVGFGSRKNPSTGKTAMHFGTDLGQHRTNSV